MNTGATVIRAATVRERTGRRSLPPVPDRLLTRAALIWSATVIRALIGGYVMRFPALVGHRVLIIPSVAACFAVGLAVASALDRHGRVGPHTTAMPGPEGKAALDGTIVGVVGFQRPPSGRGGRTPPRDLTEEWRYETSAPALSSPCIARVDGDAIRDIVVTTYDPVNPYQAGRVYAIGVDGNDLGGWPKVTLGPLPGSAAVVDIDDNGDQEVIVGSWQQAYVWNGDGTAYTGWPKNYGTYSSPAVSDLDRDGDLEIIYSTTGKQLYVWHHDGTTMAGWPFTSPELVGTPAVADIDRDGVPEIAAGTYEGPVGPDPFEVYVWEIDGSVAPGFPVSTSGVVKAPVALGDIDLDGEVEIIAVAYHTSNDDYLYVWDAEANLEPGWPVQAPYIRLSGPALGDLDGNGDLEIVIGGLEPGSFQEQVFAFHHDGTLVSGWPVVLPHEGGAGNINSSPVIADIDGDPSLLEVVVKVTNHVFAVHADGTIVADFPYYLSDESHTGTFSPSPAVGDCDDDGDVEYVFVSNYGTIAFFDEDAGFSRRHAFWPMSKHDPERTGHLPYPRGDANCDGTVDMDDIAAFALAMTDPVAYARSYPACDIDRTDMNYDGLVNGRDIGPLVELLIGG